MINIFGPQEENIQIIKAKHFRTESIFGAKGGLYARGRRLMMLLLQH